MIKRLFWCVFLGFLALSCLDEPDCFNLNNNVVGISFRRLFDDKADTVQVVAVRIEGTDSVFQFSSPTNTSIQIPINYLQQSATITIDWVDAYGEEQRDTVILGYTAKAQYVSEDCGERYIVSDLIIKESHYASDSGRVINDSPGTVTSKTSNVLLYRCPLTNFVKFSFRQLYMDNDSLGKKMNVSLNDIALDYTPDIYYENGNMSDYRLPLNRTVNSTAIDFNFPTETARVSLNYDKQDTILYGTCGTQQLYKNLVITENDFGDDLLLYKDSIQDPPVNNILVRRCPDTNLMKVVFRSTVDATATVSKNLQSVSASYFTEDIVFDNPVRELVLPLDITANSSTFTFVFDDATLALTVSYSRESTFFHNFCESTVISNLQVTASAFADEVIQNTDIKFPIVTNLALVKN